MIILIYEIYNIIFPWLIISDLKSQKVFKINFLTIKLETNRNKTINRTKLCYKVKNEWNQQPINL